MSACYSAGGAVAEPGSLLEAVHEAFDAVAFATRNFDARRTPPTAAPPAEVVWARYEAALHASEQQQTRCVVFHRCAGMCFLCTQQRRAVQEACALWGGGRQAGA